jgi:hypothetical protein
MALLDVLLNTAGLVFSKVSYSRYDALAKMFLAIGRISLS